LKREFEDYEAEYAEREKTIEIITTRLQGRKYTKNGETDDHKYYIDMTAEDVEKKKDKLKDRKTELKDENKDTIKLIELTNDQMKDTTKRMEIAAAQMNAAKPEQGLAFIIIFIIIVIIIFIINA
jgi:hypothetical protein